MYPLEKGVLVSIQGGYSYVSLAWKIHAIYPPPHAATHPKCLYDPRTQHTSPTEVFLSYELELELDAVDVLDASLEDDAVDWELDEEESDDDDNDDGDEDEDAKLPVERIELILFFAFARDFARAAGSMAFN